MGGLHSGWRGIGEGGGGATCFRGGSGEGLFCGHADEVGGDGLRGVHISGVTGVEKVERVPLRVSAGRDIRLPRASLHWSPFVVCPDDSA